MKFCYDNCKHLSITEYEQDKLNKGKKIKLELPPHYCKKYNKRLWHGILHPKLIRLGKCTYEE